MARLRTVVYGLLMLFVTAGSIQADVFHTTLDHGLTVLIEENHANPIVSVQVFVRTGSIYEQEFLGSGLSHFFEHIISGGTTSNRTEEESRAILETIGNNTNAYTTVDHTAYYIHTTSQHWPTALNLLADWMLNSQITEKEFLREKGVVQRELEQGLDNPLRQLFQLTRETRFKVHPARYPVIGYKTLVQQVSRDDLLTYYRRMYTPNNMILVVVGDVDTQDALDRIRLAFSSGERRSLPALSLPQEPPQVSMRTAVKEMEISQAHMNLAFRTVPLTHPDLYPLDVLSYILSRGESSRLVKRLKHDQQLVYRIRSGSFTPHYAPGSLSVWATLEPEQVEAAKAEILDELYRLRDDLVSPAELLRAKKQKIAEHVFGRQSVQERARHLGIDMLSTHDPNFGDTYVAHIQQVTAESIREVARRYLHEDALSLTIVRPKPKPSEREIATSPVETETHVMQKRVLPNGLTLLLERNPALPIVNVQAYLMGGVRVETPETNGLTRLMAHLLLKGTPYRSAHDIATAFDAMGGSIEANSGNNSFFVKAACLAEDLPKALDIFADVIMRPTFPQAEVDKTRRLMIAALRRQQDDWRAELRNLFHATHFSTSPYRLRPAGRAAALAQLKRVDVAAFHQRYAVPNNMVLAIVGDIDTKRTVALVERAFTGFQPRDITFPNIAADPPPTHTRREVKRTRKQVAAIQVGFAGTTIDNVKDRYA
ncbi:M16 family metallopeptidase, partial [Candidatus Entotheonella palauensis]|uniref:M16 family metallopeptidase n=1 Tax=Candidatus Entotheonella palauensis TaxID=93172 RepID=UPI000B7E95EF